jgi:hypothetical protein
MGAFGLSLNAVRNWNIRLVQEEVSFHLHKQTG